tara:strand:- start:881 stop:1864 length:984 start_codon:yes stop_codon:yes gene_type:complete
MINDFFEKFLTKNPVIDDYGLSYNHGFAEEIQMISNNYSLSQLSNKVLIKCSGDGVVDFLNTQFTNDIKKLGENEILLSGYCNPKGRLISVFYVFQLDTDYYLYTTLDSSELLIKKLNMYKMALKINFEPVNNLLIGVSNIKENPNFSYNELLEKKIMVKDDSIIFLLYDNYAVISTSTGYIQENLNIENTSLLGYKSSDFLDIYNYTPFLNKLIIEAFTPQMISLDTLKGVSFEKGCYPGQEIVARTHYLGEAKKSLFRFDVEANEDLDATKKLQNKDNKLAGEIVNIIKIDNNKYSCLGVLRKEFATQVLSVDSNNLVSNVKGVE